MMRVIWGFPIQVLSKEYKIRAFQMVSVAIQLIFCARSTISVGKWSIANTEFWFYLVSIKTVNRENLLEQKHWLQKRTFTEYA